ncbi:hypothetical protein [Mycobacterium sp. E787]|uniref:hypothetical protein n=1 Tax=Mycobacterium sp. E787 TaxID=1834150 RepID=UPI0012EA2E26|nr:hypothetical protein [Mycobacterium sp. E787]
MRLKDDVLFELSRNYNVAQFASFGPGDPTLRHHAVRDEVCSDGSLEDTVASLLRASTSRSINIRSFSAARPAGNPFHYGISSVETATALIRKLAKAGLYTIANETLDINDGGVSGVAAGGIVEFAPGDTPRAVEKPGIARLPIEVGFEVLQNVYGFPVDFGHLLGTRLEFSLHPFRCGTRYEHTIVWEASDYVAGELKSEITWPNHFSRFLGDKAFGLIVADSLGHPVPYTTVVGRNLAPFSFGTRTHTGEWWMRTAPKEPVAGKYTTTFGWTDPFDVLNCEDTEHRILASVLSQEGVDALYSGATKPTDNPEFDVVEGVSGRGDRFMVGRDAPQELPKEVIEDVRKVTADLRKQLGGIRIEWAHDGSQVWILQMHRVFNASSKPVGRHADAPVTSWLSYETIAGLETLRDLIAAAATRNQGIEVVGDFGLTSHIGELLSSSPVPIRLRRPAP